LFLFKLKIKHAIFISMKTIYEESCVKFSSILCQQLNCYEFLLKINLHIHVHNLYILMNLVKI